MLSFVKSSKDARGEPSQETLLSAVEAAERGAEATGQMKPQLGRSSYLLDRVLGHPDPGAKAVGIWLRAVRKRSSRFSAELPGRNLPAMDPQLPLEIGTICSISSADP
jgi:dihydroxyacetone kinase